AKGPRHPRRPLLALLVRRSTRGLARRVRDNRVLRELSRIEVHLSQIARGIAFRLVVEMRALRVATFAAGCDRSRADAVTELNDGDEAVAARAVPLLRVGILTGRERRERSPLRRREHHRDA